MEGEGRGWNAFPPLPSCNFYDPRKAAIFIGFAFLLHSFASSRRHWAAALINSRFSSNLFISLSLSLSFVSLHERNTETRVDSEAGVMKKVWTSGSLNSSVRFFFFFFGFVMIRLYTLERMEFKFWLNFRREGIMHVHSRRALRNTEECR